MRGARPLEAPGLRYRLPLLLLLPHLWHKLRQPAGLAVDAGVPETQR